MKRMYDTKKIVTGLVLFLIVVTSPIWYNSVFGTATYVPELKIERDSKKCVERTDYMRRNHMELLKFWRDEVVRKGERIFRTSDGTEFEMSLSGTCLKCHKNKDEFCDRCHKYLGKSPKCWMCHNVPLEAKK